MVLIALYLLLAIYVCPSLVSASDSSCAWGSAGTCKQRAVSLLQSRFQVEAIVRADEEPMDSLAGSRAIVVFSDRELACSDHFWEQLHDYANRVNATLHHVSDVHGPEFQHLQCSLTKESIRFAKYAMMPFFLQRYAEVALFDDSIMLSEFAPDIFSLGAGTQAVKGTYDPSPILQEHCDTYGVPSDKCALERRFVNSGLLVFSREHHMHLFDEPCDRWKLSGNFYDQALFNAVFMKQRTPIYDLNGEGASAEHHRCSTRMPHTIGSRDDVDAGRCGAFQEWVANASSCFLLFGTQMAILSKSGYLAKAAESACLAHVTRGSFSERDHLLCDISRLLLCKGQVARSEMTVQPVELVESPRMLMPLAPQGGAAATQTSPLSEIVDEADWTSCSRMLAVGGRES